MDVLTDLLAPERRPEHDDFVRRYEEGPPWAGFDDAEAYREYEEVAPRLSDDDFRSSAQEAFARLTPEQRREFGRWLRTQSHERGASVPDLDRDGIDDRLEDPDYLAGATTQLRRQDPGLLDGLLGGVLGGGAAGGLLSSPIARAAIGGIAAMALSKLMGRR